MAARRVAPVAARRTDPSSIHCSVVRSSMRWRSRSGSRGSRGNRRDLTSSERRSASVCGRAGRPSRRAPGRASGRPRPPRLSGRPPERPSLRPLPERPSLPLREPEPDDFADERPGPLGRPDGRRESSRRGGRDDEPEDMAGHATGPISNPVTNGSKTRRTHRRQTRAVRSSIEIRRRPTLPGDHSPSTIGADRLNFRVRDGNGCDPVAMVTEISCQ